MVYYERRWRDGILVCRFLHGRKRHHSTRVVCFVSVSLLLTENSVPSSPTSVLHEELRVGLPPCEYNLTAHPKSVILPFVSHVGFLHTLTTIISYPGMWTRSPYPTPRLSKISFSTHISSPLPIAPTSSPATLGDWTALGSSIGGIGISRKLLFGVEVIDAW